MLKFFLSCLLLLILSDSFSQVTDSINGYPAHTVQVEAKFPGGQLGWRKYLEANLNAELGSRVLKPKKGETLRQTAIVVFLVDNEGNVKEVSVENSKDVHPRLVKEAIRVIEEGPKWIPAVQNGKNVIYRQKQSITWQASYE